MPRRERLKQLTTLCALMLALARPLHAQRAATVPASSAIYDRIEAVAARFPARGVHLGQRPLSRFAIERIVARLSTAVDRDTSHEESQRTWARELLLTVTDALSPTAAHGRVVAVAGARVEDFASNAPLERIEPNGLGEIDATTQPFAAGRQGAPVGDGNFTRWLPTTVVGIGNRFAIAAEPDVFVIASHDSGASLDARMERLYARAVIHNWALQIGSDERGWGQSPIGSLWISGNAAPVPAISIGFDTALTLPWLFRYAGSVQGTLFVADLGADQDPPHARLAGWQASIQPWSRFELGVAVLDQTGGSGGPKATFLRRVIDLFPAIDALAPQHADLQFSNKLAAGNLRLRFPELSGLEFYYELQVDDFDARRLRSSMSDDAGHLLGLRLPIALREGELAWRAEWHRTSLRLYEHAQFLSGVTYHERIIGDPIGPNAGAGYLSLTWQRAPLSSFSLALADERRNPSQYATTASPRDSAFHFIRLTHDPDYRRWRVVATGRRAVGGKNVELSAGYNRAWRPGERARNQWMGAVSLGSGSMRSF